MSGGLQSSGIGERCRRRSRPRSRSSLFSTVGDGGLGDLSDRWPSWIASLLTACLQPWCGAVSSYHSLHSDVGHSD